MSTTSVSLCLIVRNESPRLAGCLGSAAGAVDEVVVVDTGSTDDTPAVAQHHGARVVAWAWRDDFAAARNESLRHATGDWVLVLDADERLAPGGAARVRAAATADGPAGHDCRIVSRLPPGQPAPEVASWYCRLFRRGPGVAFEGRVHEQVAPSILRHGGRIARSDVTILHEGYAEASPARVLRNCALLEQMLAEQPGHAFTLMNLGLTLQAADDWPAARAALEQAVASRIAPLAPGLRAVALAHLGEAHLHAAQWAEAADAAGAALLLDPALGLARWVLGRAHFELGRFDEAGEAFEALLAAPADSLGMRLHPHLPALGLGLCRLRQRRFAEAAEALEVAALADATGEGAFHLGNARLGLEDPAAAAEAYARAVAQGYTHPDLDRRLALCRRLTSPLTPPAPGAGDRP